LIQWTTQNQTPDNRKHLKTGQIWVWILNVGLFGFSFSKTGHICPVFEWSTSLDRFIIKEIFFTTIFFIKWSRLVTIRYQDWFVRISNGSDHLLTQPVFLHLSGCWARPFCKVKGLEKYFIHDKTVKLSGPIIECSVLLSMSGYQMVVRFSKSGLGLNRSFDNRNCPDIRRSLY
jgi:hypothetical protein